nr:hypothetical protein [Candidatus Sigynarchaeum springense]
ELEPLLLEIIVLCHDSHDSSTFTSRALDKYGYHTDINFTQSRDVYVKTGRNGIARACIISVVTSNVE